jgi:CBS domain-containing protein
MAFLSLAVSSAGGHLDETSRDEDVEKAAKLMEEKRIRRIVVQDDRGAYVGVVSLSDLAQITEDRQLAANTLEKVTEPQ